VESFTLIEQQRACSAMNSAIHSTAAKQAGICRVNDGINSQRGDINLNRFYPIFHVLNKITTMYLSIPQLFS
jgi:hypothetical protein